MAYVKIIFQNSPSTATPMNAQNLNHMDDQIALNDQRLTELEGAHVSSFNGRTGAVAPTDGDYNIGQIAPLTGAQVGQVPVVTNIGTEEDPELVFRMGAGGSGGHTIQNASGANMPQEENLQFVGLKVTDDSTNGKTIVDATDKVTWEANGVLGAKNLIPYPYDEVPSTKSGITFEVDNNGIITVSGEKTTAGLIQYYPLKDVVGYNGYLFDRLKVGESYTLSGCPSGGSVSTYELRLILNFKKEPLISRIIVDTGNGITFTVTDEVKYARLMIDYFGEIGTDYGELIFKPMLRLAEDTDPTYQPYARTNKQLTDDVKDVWKANGRLGAKNLVPYPFFNPNPTYTNNGVTFTDNDDGTITANGTASSSANATCHFIARTVSNYKLPLGKYILTGCPEGGSSTTYRIGVNRTVNGSASTYGYDYGSGFIFEVTDDTVTTGCYIDIIKGVTVNNLVFKPMIRVAEDIDDTYQPYAMSNYELTQKIRELETAIVELGGN